MFPRLLRCSKCSHLAGHLKAVEGGDDLGDYEENLRREVGEAERISRVCVLQRGSGVLSYCVKCP